LAFNGRLEGNEYFLEFGGGFMIPAESEELDHRGYGGIFAEFGASYYLTHSEVSPYIGAGVMPRILSSQPGNIAAYGQVGAMFFRSSSSRLYVDGRITQNLTTMYFDRNNFEPSSDNASRSALPTELGLNVGVGW
jgi:hypothetical protein